MTTSTKPKTTKAKAKKEEKVKEAQGLQVVTATWGKTITEVTPKNIPKFQTNIHYLDALESLNIQVFPAPPELWVTDADGETDEELTNRLKEDFARLDCYSLMQNVLTDTYGFGPFIYSIGRQLVDGRYTITDIRRLPPQNFAAAPMSAGLTTSTPNYLVPGIILNADGEPEYWEQQASGNQIKLENVQTVVIPGAPKYGGRPYMLPVYYILSLIDYASHAQMQQMQRIGAPILLPKISDEITDPDSAMQIVRWAKQFSKTWGKDSVGLVPQGVEFAELKITESGVAKDAIATWVEWIHHYANPMANMEQTGGLGTSDSGRMEMWANFIASRQQMCEEWLEKEFDWCLEANGYSGYTTNIMLKRPSIDRAVTKLQYISTGLQNGTITTKEARDNSTDILELQETNEELLAELESKKQVSNPFPFGNMKVDNFTNPEDKIMTDAAKSLEDIYGDAYRKIIKTLEE